VTEREQLDYATQRIYLFLRAEGKCEVCGRRINSETMQLAHRIPQTKRNLKKYGKEVIHHPKNLRATCSLSCNSKVDIRNHPVAQSNLLAEIEEEIDAKE